LFISYRIGEGVWGKRRGQGDGVLIYGLCHRTIWGKLLLKGPELILAQIGREMGRGVNKLTVHVTTDNPLKEENTPSFKKRVRVQ